MTRLQDRPSMHSTGSQTSGPPLENMPPQNTTHSPEAVTQYHQRPCSEQPSRNSEIPVPLPQYSVNQIKIACSTLFMVLGALYIWLMIRTNTPEKSIWSYTFYWNFIILGAHAAVTAVLLFRIYPAPDEWCASVAIGKCFIIFLHVISGLVYAKEPDHPNFWLLGLAVWAWSDAVATVVLIDFSGAWHAFLESFRCLMGPVRSILDEEVAFITNE